MRGCENIFYSQPRDSYSVTQLFPLASLMSRSCKEFSVLMLSHLFSSLLYNAAQKDHLLYKIFT